MLDTHMQRNSINSSYMLFFSAAARRKKGDESDDDASEFSEDARKSEKVAEMLLESAEAVETKLLDAMDQCVEKRCQNHPCSPNGLLPPRV